MSNKPTVLDLADALADVIRSFEARIAKLEANAECPRCEPPSTLERAQPAEPKEPKDRTLEEIAHRYADATDCHHDSPRAQFVMKLLREAQRLHNEELAAIFESDVAGINNWAGKDAAKRIRSRRP